MKPSWGLNMRKAFTLTELLVVITIIAVLAALGTAGIMRAMGTARQTRTKVEVDNLDAALKSYKERFGSYPPCDLRKGIPAVEARIKSHVARSWPRYYDLSKAVDDILAVVDPNGANEFRPDAALVFWLNGFNKDITHPFLDLGGATPLPKSQRGDVMFEFDQGRINSNSPNGVTNYLVHGTRKNCPYLYFDGQEISGLSPPLSYNTLTATADASTGVAAPYHYDANQNRTLDSTEDVANADSFQIIAPGADDAYGALTGVANVPRLYPIGFNYAPQDDDNITNFCERARLGDARP